MRDIPGRILVRAPNWVGDVLMATPALRALRRSQPQAEIVVEGRAWLPELLWGLESIDAFIADPGRGIAGLAARWRGLREAGFDWAMLLPDSPRAALGPFLARIPVRAGYARDPLRRLLLTEPLDPPRAAGRRVPISMIERFLRITRALGCADAGVHLDLAVRGDARARIESRLGAGGIGLSEQILVVAPGASFGPSKLWPPSHFASACDGIERRLGLRTVLAPGPGEEPIAAEIARRMASKPLELSAPPTSLAELAALVARARLVLSNDTGARHIAVALGTPVVVLLGPTDERHTAHLLERQRVLREAVPCSPCHHKVCPIDHRCMIRLGPDRAISSAVELLG
jgi:heptosyltransferase-2